MHCKEMESILGSKVLVTAFLHYCAGPGSGDSGLTDIGKVILLSALCTCFPKSFAVFFSSLLTPITVSPETTVQTGFNFLILLVSTLPDWC